VRQGHARYLLPALCGSAPPFAGSVFSCSAPAWPIAVREEALREYPYAERRVRI